MFQLVIKVTSILQDISCGIFAMLQRSTRRIRQLHNHLQPARCSSTATTGAEITSATTTTHNVINQATALTNYNAFSDVALQQGVEKYEASWGYDDLSALGNQVGSAEWQQRSLNANKNGPEFQPFDRFGHRIESVHFQEDYHSLLNLGISSGAASYAWQEDHRGKKGAHVIRGGLMYLMYQLNPGVCCPITMTFAAVPALEGAATTSVEMANNLEKSFVHEMIKKLCTPSYSGANEPISTKEGITVGMSMTEKQGGSDVRANTTTAVPIQNTNDSKNNNSSSISSAYHLVGHKWFTSAPMSDAFLTLAQTKNGISCFIVPRWLPSNEKNVGFQLQRLKDKLGDKSNASSEVEYRNAVGYMVGPEGRGVRTIVDMVTHTRLDCIIGSAALMRQCSQLAVHHCKSRNAFGKTLINQPLMKAVLSDLAIESESAMALWMRLAAALDRCSDGNKNLKEAKHEAAFVRLGTAVAKYWVCKRAPTVAYEAMECHGGNGYIEEGPMAALYRQSPLNGKDNCYCFFVYSALFSNLLFFFLYI